MSKIFLIDEGATDEEKAICQSLLEKLSNSGRRAGAIIPVTKDEMEYMRDHMLEINLE